MFHRAIVERDNVSENEIVWRAALRMARLYIRPTDSEVLVDTPSAVLAVQVSAILTKALAVLPSLNRRDLKHIQQLDRYTFLSAAVELLTTVSSGMLIEKFSSDEVTTICHVILLGVINGYQKPAAGQLSVPAIARHFILTAGQDAMGVSGLCDPSKCDNDFIKSLWPLISNFKINLIPNIKTVMDNFDDFFRAVLLKSVDAGERVKANI